MITPFPPPPARVELLRVRRVDPKHGDSPLPILLNPPVIPHEHCPQLGFCRSPAG